MSLSHELRQFLRTVRSEDQLRRFRRERKMNLSGDNRTIPKYDKGYFKSNDVRRVPRRDESIDD